MACLTCRHFYHGGRSLHLKHLDLGDGSSAGECRLKRKRIAVKHHYGCGAWAGPSEEELSRLSLDFIHFRNEVVWLSETVAKQKQSLKQAKEKSAKRLERLKKLDGSYAKGRERRQQRVLKARNEADKRSRCEQRRGKAKDEVIRLLKSKHSLSEKRVEMLIKAVCRRPPYMLRLGNGCVAQVI